MNRPPFLLAFATITIATITLATTACNWLIPIAFLGDHKKTMPPEYDKLVGKRALILVWAPPETLFDYPYARLELASYIGDRIRAKVENADVVDPQRVEDWLLRDPDASVSPRETGTYFEADTVVYVELLEFQMRDPTAPDLLRGKLSANVAVFDLRSDADEISRFPLAGVDVAYPDQPAIMSAANAVTVRQQTYDAFAEKVARKFYEHQVDL
jgi:hypothetical protein